MAIAPTDIGVAGVVAMFAIDKLYNLVRNKGNGSVVKCADAPNIIANLERNKQSLEIIKAVNTHLTAIASTNTEMVTILRSIDRNGKR